MHTGQWFTNNLLLLHRHTDRDAKHNRFKPFKPPHSHSHCYIKKEVFKLSWFHYPFLSLSPLVGYLLPQHINKSACQGQRPLQYCCCSFTFSFLDMLGISQACKKDLPALRNSRSKINMTKMKKHSLEAAGNQGSRAGQRQAAVMDAQNCI